MKHHNRFVICNDWSRLLILNLEPEGAFFRLRKGKAVTVIDEFSESPVTLKLSSSETGDPIVSIWPGDAELRVEQDGVDVLELAQECVGV